MGKRTVEGKRLRIHRETLRALGSAALGGVQGGVLITEWINNTSADTNPKSTAWTGRDGAAICTR
jgi:hypothetical protein